MNKRNLRIYIHWPFCLFKCPYCDFNSHEISKNEINKSKNVKLWIDSYLKEINFYKNLLINSKIDSIYFGGGTPSLMDPSIIKNIIDHLKSLSIFDQQIEITLEANPTSIESSKFLQFKEAGINRVSIGVQSLRPEHLKFLGREHSLSEALKSIEIANSIFGKRFSFDLIYGLPLQKPSEWANDLRRIFDLNFENQHISLYQLTIEKGTKFFGMHKESQFQMPDENLQSEFYDLTREICLEHGFEAYEISNYSKSKEYNSKHNMGYWNYEDYLGIGPGAHSRIGFNQNDSVKIAAFFDIYKPENWLNSLNHNDEFDHKDIFNFQKNKPGFIQNIEILENQKILEEMILMGLRKKEGILLDFFQKRFGADKKFFDLIDKDIIFHFSRNEFLEINENSLFLTTKGLKVSDFIIKKICDNLL